VFTIEMVFQKLRLTYLYNILKNNLSITIIQMKVANLLYHGRNN